MSLAVAYYVRCRNQETPQDKLRSHNSYIIFFFINNIFFTIFSVSHDKVYIFTLHLTMTPVFKFLVHFVLAPICSPLILHGVVHSTLFRTCVCVCACIYFNMYPIKRWNMLTFPWFYSVPSTIGKHIMFLDIIRPVYISKHNVSETGFFLRLQVEPTHLRPIDRASPYLQTSVPAPRYGTQAKHRTNYLRELK
jgi:hypothetical protein